MNATRLGHFAGGLGLLFSATCPIVAATGAQVQARVDADVANGKPIVVHVVVALCDNENQGIVPVPAKLGDGQEPRSNLYWGALYGVKTHFSSHGWRSLASDKPADERILRRIVFFQTLTRGDQNVPVYVVADAWDGAKIRGALARFLAMTTGDASETVRTGGDDPSIEIHAGGSAHLLAFVGHNGLMDFDLPRPADPPDEQSPRSSVVLACASKEYFLDRLESAKAHPLLLTTGLMAPEAYTLDAVVRRWVVDGSTDVVREAAAEAYDRYQKCGIRAARNLFWGAP